MGQIRVFPTTVSRDSGLFMCQSLSTQKKSSLLVYSDDLGGVRRSLLEEFVYLRKMLADTSLSWGASFLLEGQDVEGDLVTLIWSPLKQTYPGPPAGDHSAHGV